MPSSISSTEDRDGVSIAVDFGGTKISAARISKNEIISYPKQCNASHQRTKSVRLTYLKNHKPLFLMPFTDLAWMLQLPEAISRLVPAGPQEW